MLPTWRSERQSRLLLTSGMKTCSWVTSCAWNTPTSPCSLLASTSCVSGMPVLFECLGDQHCINSCAHDKDPVVHVRGRWIMETLKHLKMHRRLSRANLSQLAFLGESNPIFFPWEKSHWDDIVVKTNVSPRERTLHSPTQGPRKAWRPHVWNVFLSHFSPDVILCGWLGSKHQLTN